MTGKKRERARRRSKHKVHGADERRSLRRTAGITWLAIIVGWVFFGGLLALAVPDHVTVVMLLLLGVIFIASTVSMIRIRSGRGMSIVEKGLAGPAWLLVGAGSRPIETARDSDEGRRALLFSIVVTAIVVIGVVAMIARRLM